MRGWVPLVVVVWLLQVLGYHAFGGYPGTFYQIMLRLNKERKYARTGPSPSRLWAILDPAASLGSLSHEPLNSNRIVRSADFFSWMLRSRQVRQEAVGENAETEVVSEGTEAEAVTENTEMETVAEDIQTPVEAGMDTTADHGVAVAQPTPATEECGGNITMTDIPRNGMVQNGIAYKVVLVTPGWKEGQYPEDFECVWNLNVELECQAGLLLYKVLEGEVRETQNCNEDYLEIIQPNDYTNKYCGPLSGSGNRVSGTDTWSSAQRRTTVVRFKSGVRHEGGGFSVGNPRGMKLEATYYCWLYNKDLATTQAPSEAQQEAADSDGSVSSGGAEATAGEADMPDLAADTNGVEAVTTGGEADTTGREADTTSWDGTAETLLRDTNTTGGEADATGDGADKADVEADTTVGEADTAGGDTTTKN